MAEFFVEGEGGGLGAAGGGGRASVEVGDIELLGRGGGLGAGGRLRYTLEELKGHQYGLLEKTILEYSVAERAANGHVERIMTHWILEEMAL